MGTVGGIIVAVAFAVGLLAGYLAPHPIDEMSLASRLKPPSSKFLMGTDALGRDVLSRIIFGARISMTVGIGTSFIVVILSTIIGILCGFLGGKFDMVVQRFVDAWMCFPSLFIVLTVMAVLGPGLWQVIVVIGLQRGITNSRLVRSAVIGIRENLYVAAARAIGASRLKILKDHILPNIMAPIIILFSVTLGAAILIEATISFLGFGIPPPNPTWGGMLSEEGRKYMLQAPWVAFWPGLALSVVVFGANMLGDAMRDLLDPRLRGGSTGGYKQSKKKTKAVKPNNA